MKGAIVTYDVCQGIEIIDTIEIQLTKQEIHDKLHFAREKLEEDTLVAWKNENLPGHKHIDDIYPKIWIMENSVELVNNDSIVNNC